MEVTLGGERLGAGKKEKVHLREYERSTHDLSYVWRSTMASGTLVPFLTEVALPGDSFDINLNCDVKTHPTIGPLFGSFKVQLDVFLCPIRLYQGKLHMNMLGIGLDMSQVKLPQIEVVGLQPRWNRLRPIDNQQVNPSCILSYLNIRGIGREATSDETVGRQFNAVPYLAYFDIYKQYYANKQEEIGYIIHNNMEDIDAVPLNAYFGLQGGIVGSDVIPYWNNDGATATAPTDNIVAIIGERTKLFVTFDTIDEEFDLDKLMIQIGVEGEYGSIVGMAVYPVTRIFTDAKWTLDGNPQLALFGVNEEFYGQASARYITLDRTATTDSKPKLRAFQLDAIDQMRKDLLMAVDDVDAYVINVSSAIPYSSPLKFSIGAVDGEQKFSATSNQEGLLLKTYQSDLFNNWISTEWIDGENGINEITRVSTAGDSFTIDELNLSKKIYDMLNRIAISGGSYDDWLDTTYTHQRNRGAENPMYMGGLIQELVFQEVISNAESSGQALGTLAGRGVLSGKRKGGTVKIKVDEPSYIMGIVSLTPRVDYSQGNKWDTNLKTMNDFHKPALDEIGFQNLITDQMAWFETVVQDATLNTTFKSAGKQPAWINYMTNVNQVRGNFADESQQMFMVLNRRYEPKFNSDNSIEIKDLTTYIDPSKFNHIFADTRLDAQNFWTQIGVNMTARRKMSAKVIPNL